MIGMNEAVYRFMEVQYGRFCCEGKTAVGNV